MDELIYWRLCDELSIVQAALLGVGLDPADNPYVENRDLHKRPYGYEALKTALLNAAVSGSIKAQIVEASERVEQLDPDGDHIGFKQVLLGRPDLERTLVNVDDIRRYLAQRGLKSGFFFDNEPRVEYSNSDPTNFVHPQYAPKLAAAIDAWVAVTNNPSLLNGKTPKQALKAWLIQNAKKYDLVKSDGTPNLQGIDEVCKVANWKPQGGVAPTPQKLPIPTLATVAFDLDDEPLPF